MSIHEGRNARRVREIIGMNKKTLAAKLHITPQGLSYIEAKDKIDENMIKKLAKALGVTVELIRNFNEEKAINVIANNSFENCEQPASIFYDSTINPLEKLVEVVGENKKLYEMLMKEKEEKIALLERMLQSKN